ncbi:MAG: VCBS repeat-containing protein [Opitutaceae bacterium]
MRAFLRWGCSLALVAALTVHSPLSGNEGSPPVLGGPEIIKLDWNTRRLVPADFNQDGRMDLALINNDRARIEMLIQRDPARGTPPANRRVQTNRWEPVLEDSRFDKLPLTVGITVFDLAAGDLNGDGRTDLAYTGIPDSLTIRLQSEDGGWEESQVIDIGAPSPYITCLLIEDLDGDDRADLIVILDKDLVVLRQDGDGKLEAPERYAFSDGSNHSLRLADLDQDGRKDVLYLASDSRDSLRVRFQGVTGRLGPENPYRIENSMTSMELINFGEGNPPGLAHIRSRTALLTVVSLVEDPAVAGGVDAINPRVYSTGVGSRNPPDYAFGDIDGDGRLDLALTDPDGAQVICYFQDEVGQLGEAQRFPSLTDGRSIAAVTWEGMDRAEIYLASPKERILGATVLGDEGRLHFPRPVEIEGKPLAVSGSPGLKGSGPLLAVAVESGGKRSIQFMEKSGAALVTTQSLELENLRTDPKCVRFLDANHDGRDDLAVFVPFEALRILLQQEDGTFVDISRGPGYRSGLVDKLDPSALTMARTNGLGSSTILVSGPGFARAIEVDDEGALQVVDQFNAREATTEISAAFAVDLDGDNEREILLFDQRNREIEVLRRNERGVYVYADAVPVGSISLVAGHQLDFDGDGREDLFFLGKDRFWLLPMGVPGRRAEVVFSYETDIENVRYGDVAIGDLNNDGIDDYVAIDPRRNLIEILTRVESRVESSLHFLVFESDPNVKARGSQSGEPRETLVVDLTGDGRKDLVLLVHDRVLLYPNEGE